MASAGIAEGYRRSTGEEDLSLTRREREVIWLAGQDKANKDIARVLGISICTVKIHLSNIYSKLGVSRRADAVKAARLQGQLPPRVHLVSVR